MFGKRSHLRTLESRKQELLAESEVNRIELLKDFEALKAEANRAKKQLLTAGTIASSAAILAGAASLLRRRETEPSKTENQAKGAWVSGLLNGARAGASLAFKIRSLMRPRR